MGGMVLSLHACITIGCSEGAGDVCEQREGWKGERKLSFHLTDEEIDNLIRRPKYYFSDDLRRAKWYVQDGHRKRELPLKSDNGAAQLSIFWRQNLEDQLDFTVGLAYKFPDTNVTINLIRCNGNSHQHKNTLERTKFSGVFHVHRATERYMEMDPLKAENYADVVDGYNEIDGALRYLCEIAHIEERMEGMRQLDEFRPE